MKIAFIDPIGWDYTVATPYERPFGGSQSALCYLAEALAKLGHEVRLLNHRTEPAVVRGVSVGCLFSQSTLEGLRGFDAVVVLNGIHTDLARQVRAIVGTKTFMAFWTQHAHDQPAVGNLHDPAMLAVWDAYVLISDWQAEQFRAVFGLPADRIRILRNAIAPAFAGRQPQPRTGAPVLAYTSTPFRGLDLLLDAFPRIRAAVPGTVLRVYSSMGVYQVVPERDQYAGLYARCQSMEGVEYVGSLPQPQLAEALQQVTALTYPNTFPETSCISVMEALASGCHVITTDLGALPETAAGWGQLLPPLADRGAMAEVFADLTVSVLQGMERAPSLAAARRDHQVRRINATTTWTVRAREWAEWLALAVSEHRDTVVRAASTSPIQELTGTAAVDRGLTLTRGRHGLFLGADDSGDETQAIRLYGEWLEPVVRVLGYTLRAGGTIVTAGTGTGGLAVPLAGRIGADGRLVCFAADNRASLLLGANLALNGITHAAIRPLPAGPLDGDEAVATLDSCRLLLLDEGIGDPVALLAGADRLVSRCRPFLHAPVYGAGGFAALAAWAAWKGYRLYWNAAYAYAPDNALGQTENLSGRAGRLAVLGVPGDAATQIVGTSAVDFAEATALYPGL